MQQIASQNAPSPGIVIPHFLFGAITWIVITTLIVFSPEAFTQHYFNPKLLSITHLLVLGWVSMIIFGALYQLIPVIMEVKLYSEKLALGSFILLASGSILLALAFWNFWLGTIMHIAAALLLTAISFFVVNVLVTGSKSSKKSIEKKFIQTSVIWLLFTVIAGITLAINLTHAFLSPSHLELLKLHANAGIAGWIIQLIIGVGSRLLPMFLVAHNLNTNKLKFAYYLINTGLVISVISLYVQWYPGIISSVVMIVLGVIAFLSFLLEAYRKRVKKHLDIGMKQSALSFVALTIPIVLIVLFLFESEQLRSLTLQMAIAYGSTLLIGFVTLLIMGQTYKTLPFIIWLNVYRNKIGKGKIPFPKELYSEKIARAQLWCFAFGFTFFLIGVLIRNDVAVGLGGLTLLISALLYNFNVWKIVLHKPILKNE
jgi:hypothetical protein